MRSIFCLMAFSALARAGCIEITTDRIFAGDLADAVPFFRALDPATVVGFAPIPGAERILSSRELALLARQHDLTTSVGTILPSVCVARGAGPISPDDLKDALLASLNMPGVAVEVLEYSRQPVAPGRLEFPLTGLNKPPADAPESPVIWRGRLVYDAQRSATVWAKVRITVPGPGLVAKDPIPAGTLIRAEQVEEVIFHRFPLSAPALGSAREVVGKIARRNIAAGQAFLASALEQPREVSTGDAVRVKVIDGLALVSFEAIAESSGRIGDTIIVHNPSSGRNFRAVVVEKGRVSVQSSPGA
jgi:flagella basal body P-ring formation protein FlgA